LRADQLITLRGLAPSRSAAQRLIDRGAVRWRTGPDDSLPWHVVRKSGDDLSEQVVVEITDDAELRWASRAGLKLEFALDQTGVQVEGLSCLDVGQSTGGFTDVLLARGARQVVGVDVGHGQLLARLANDPRVVAHEGINARELSSAALSPVTFDILVADLSFISLRLVLPAVSKRLAPTPMTAGHALLLVKPQFELQPGDVGKGGVVSDPKLHQRAVQSVCEAVEAVGWRVRQRMPCPVTGSDGNQEFFVWAAAE
jgi:23S rRNA (cytidine1920-2'-O)/16S rRNA (cytidine1409-2'-O)-methyltransferase